MNVPQPAVQRFDVPRVAEGDLQVRALELERRPKAARRLGYVASFAEPRDVPTMSAQDTNYYKMEVDRRPRAAKRIGEVRYLSVDVTEPTAFAPLPFARTAAALMEIERRPKAARRVGTFRAPALADAPPPPAMAAMDTAAFAMEVSRRRVAARRSGIVKLPRRASPRNLPSIDVADTAFYDMELDRRPRAAARLTAKASGPTSAPLDAFAELSKIAADDLMKRRAPSAFDDASFDKSNPSRGASATAPNPFASLERMLESTLDISGSKSRGSSLRGADNFNTTATGGGVRRQNSSTHLRRVGSNASMGVNNVVQHRPGRHVHCDEEGESGDVVCVLYGADDEPEDVVMTVPREQLEEQMRRMAAATSH